MIVQPTHFLLYGGKQGVKNGQGDSERFWIISSIPDVSRNNASTRDARAFLFLCIKQFYTVL
jgi:hypothetical protein